MSHAVSGQHSGSGRGEAVARKSGEKFVHPNAEGALPAYRSIKECPKCGEKPYTDFSKSYCEGGMFRVETGPMFCFRSKPHFHKRCSSCHFGWVEAGKTA